MNLQYSSAMISPAFQICTRWNKFCSLMLTSLILSPLPFFLFVWCRRRRGRRRLAAGRSCLSFPTGGLLVSLASCKSAILRCDATISYLNLHWKNFVPLTMCRFCAHSYAVYMVHAHVGHILESRIYASTKFHPLHLRDRWLPLANSCRQWHWIRERS